jgi:hypothetical protein
MRVAIAKPLVPKIVWIYVAAAAMAMSAGAFFPQIFTMNFKKC